MSALDSMLWELSLHAAREWVEDVHAEDAHLLHGGYLHEIAEIIEESVKKACRDAMTDLEHLVPTPREWGLVSDPSEAA